MAGDDPKEPKDVIVTAWQGGRISYVEALRRLLDFGVPLAAAMRWLAAEAPVDTERDNGGPS